MSFIWLFIHISFLEDYLDSDMNISNMFSVFIPDHIDEIIMPNLCNWKRVKNLLDESSDELLITNTTL